MATYMGAAWIDIAARADTEAVLDSLDDEDIEKAPQQVYARVVDNGAGRRVASRAPGHSAEQWYPDTASHATRATLLQNVAEQRRLHGLPQTDE